MISSLYAEPRPLPSVEDCYFYHVMDLPVYGNTQNATKIAGAQWDLRGRFEEYTGHCDFAGQRVLDVGCASGFLSFEMERLGASEVVSFDADDGSSIHWLRKPGSEYVENYDKWLSGSTAWLRRVQGAYWFARQQLQRNTKAYYGDVYRLPDALGKFDICLVAQLVVHLRDPIAALESVTSLCSRKLIIAETMIDSDEPFAKFGYAKDRNPWKFWSLSVGAYREILNFLGFELSYKNTATYKVCLPGGKVEEWPITTIHADRILGLE